MDIECFERDAPSGALARSRTSAELIGAFQSGLDGHWRVESAEREQCHDERGVASQFNSGLD
jgi:hypothetical protein